MGIKIVNNKSIKGGTRLKCREEDFPREGHSGIEWAYFFNNPENRKALIKLICYFFQTDDCSFYSRSHWSSTMEIRQKSESQNEGNKKTKHGNFPKKRTFLTPDTHKYVSPKNSGENIRSITKETIEFLPV